MVEIVRSNDPVELSWAQAVLAEAGIESLLFDLHTSAIEGSIGALPRRLMVEPEDLEQGRQALGAAAARLQAEGGDDR